MDVLFETRSKNNIKATDEHFRYYYLFQPIRILTYISSAFLVICCIFMLAGIDNNGETHTYSYVMYGIILLLALYLGTTGIFQYFRQKKQLLHKCADPEAAEGVSTLTEEGIRSTSADGKVYVTPFSKIRRAYIGKTAVFIWSKLQKVDPKENNGKKRIVIIHIFPKDDFTVGDAAGLVCWLESKGIKIKDL